MPSEIDAHMPSDRVVPSREFSPQILSGWGHSCGSLALAGTFSSPGARDFLQRYLPQAFGGQGIALRGLGRAYGDAAQNGGGLVMQMQDDIGLVRLDEANGIVHTPGGLSLDELLRFLVPKGFFVPVTPGTRFVTVGGAVASDIHGKNHHVDGSFGSHVERLSLLIASGEVVELSPHEDPELFWATIGGMGLTGAILDVSFRVPRIETSRCSVDTRRFNDLDGLLAAMSENDEDFKYSVAWTDLLASGSSLGRSILWRGDHTRRTDLPSSVADPLAYDARTLAFVPPVIPAPGLVNKWTSTTFNELWFRSAPKKRDGEFKTIPAYFHPLDAVGHWNRLYGPLGFIQYQFVVPFGAETALRSIVEDISMAEVATPLVVLKRFGAGNPGMLSFPMEGWTMTVDMPARVLGLAALLRRLDEKVLEAGGRHYLAKDSHMTAQTFAAGYPRLEEWRRVKERVDPLGMWSSDLARRLEIVK